MSQIFHKKYLMGQTARPYMTRQSAPGFFTPKTGAGRLVTAGALILLLVTTLIAYPAAALGISVIGEEIRAESFVLMDADTGQVLLERDMRSHRKPASITKIMTALLAVETCLPTDPVTISEAAVRANPGDGSSAGLAPGEIVPLDELLYAVMLESANEAANAVAEHVSGTMEMFVKRMNERAAELGASDTHFANANGLDKDDHYVSALDMALITREAIKHRRFLDIWSAYQHTLEPTNLQAQKRILNNKNRLLPQSSMPYKGILGGKTGYTKASLNTLVEAAGRDGRTLICVLLQGPGAFANFADAAKLLDYGFNGFDSHTYVNQEYKAERAFLLHESVPFDDVGIELGEPTENEDGSHSVTVSINVPKERCDVMYPDIAAFTMTSEPPPPAPAPTPRFPGISKFYNLSASLPDGASADDNTNESGINRMMGYLPGWLAFAIKAVFYALITLLALTVFFRTRRWIRRRRRRLRRKQMEDRMRIYRERQSFWN